MAKNLDCRALSFYAHLTICLFSFCFIYENSHAQRLPGFNPNTVRTIKTVVEKVTEIAGIKRNNDTTKAQVLKIVDEAKEVNSQKGIAVIVISNRINAASGEVRVVEAKVLKGEGTNPVDVLKSHIKSNKTTLVGEPDGDGWYRTKPKMLTLTGNSENGYRLQNLLRPDLIISAAKGQLEQEYKEKLKEIEKRNSAVERQKITSQKREVIKQKNAERRAAVAAERAFISSLLPSYSDKPSPLQTEQNKNPPTNDQRKIDDVPEDNGGHVILLGPT